MSSKGPSDIELQGSVNSITAWAKMSLSRAQNIFKPANINSVVLLLRRILYFSSLQASTERLWVITNADKLRYDAIFKQADKDRDGLVSGIGFTL